MMCFCMQEAAFDPRYFPGSAEHCPVQFLSIDSRVVPDYWLRIKQTNKIRLNKQCSPRKQFGGVGMFFFYHTMWCSGTLTVGLKGPCVVLAVCKSMSYLLNWLNIFNEEEKPFASYRKERKCKLRMMPAEGVWK